MTENFISLSWASWRTLAISEDLDLKCNKMQQDEIGKTENSQVKRSQWIAPSRLSIHTLHRLESHHHWQFY